MISMIQKYVLPPPLPPPFSQADLLKMDGPGNGINSDRIIIPTRRSKSQILLLRFAILSVWSELLFHYWSDQFHYWGQIVYD
jgi:hypothetical protein